MHLIAYNGWNQIPIQIQYYVHKKEFLAIISAIHTLNHYIDNRKNMVVITNDKRLKYL